MPKELTRCAFLTTTPFSGVFINAARCLRMPNFYNNCLLYLDSLRIRIRLLRISSAATLVIA
jgi:hypothetical protein